MSYVYKPTPKKAWLFGSKKATVRFGATPLMPGGKGWQKYIPGDERQNVDGVESYACTVYASTKAWITLSNFLGYSLPKNCSERFNAILANIVPPGADPYTVCESIRKWGMIHNDLLPFDETIKNTFEFYQPKPMDEGFIAEAKKIVQKYTLGFEYIWNESPFRAPLVIDRPKLLISALERGPVCVSVHGWKEKKGVYYKDKYDSDNHWTFLVGFKEGKYWLVHDQYAPFLKKLDWNYNFQTAMVYFLKPNKSGVAPVDVDYFTRLLNKMLETLKRLALKV